MDHQSTPYTAFIGPDLLAAGPIETLLPTLKERFDLDRGTMFLIFEDHTGRQVDFDLRGSVKEILVRAMPAPHRAGRGRPRLGVSSREVTLLPRHWEWLEQQPNGASAALRRLVDQARSQEPDKEQARLKKEAIGRFMSAMAGNLPGYEEATRALYAGDRSHFEHLIFDWPAGIRDWMRLQADAAFRC
jgi:hypothetical protein